jgi:hypothetical protein
LTNQNEVRIVQFIGNEQPKGEIEMAISAKIDFSKINLTGRDLEIAKACIGRDGGLRSSKPKDGEAAYVWRMVAFSLSNNRKHWCMPVTAEFDLPEQYWAPDAKFRLEHGIEAYETERSNRHEARRARVKELKAIEDAIINSVPRQEWYGVRRWAKAFGVIG